MTWVDLLIEAYMSVWLRPLRQEQEMTYTQKKLQKTLDNALVVLSKKKLVTPRGKGDPDVEALIAVYKKLIEDILEIELQLCSLLE